MARSWTPDRSGAAWWDDDMNDDGMIERKRYSGFDGQTRGAGSKSRRSAQQRQRSGFDSGRRPTR